MNNRLSWVISSRSAHTPETHCSYMVRGLRLDLQFWSSNRNVSVTCLCVVGFISTHLSQLVSHVILVLEVWFLSSCNITYKYVFSLFQEVSFDRSQHVLLEKEQSRIQALCQLQLGLETIWSPKHCNMQYLNTLHKSLYSSIIYLNMYSASVTVASYYLYPSAGIPISGNIFCLGLWDLTSQNSRLLSTCSSCGYW